MAPYPLYELIYLPCIKNGTSYVPFLEWESIWENSHSKHFLCAVVQMRNPGWENVSSWENEWMKILTSFKLPPLTIPFQG